MTPAYFVLLDSTETYMTEDEARAEMNRGCGAGGGRARHDDRVRRARPPHDHGDQTVMFEFDYQIGWVKFVMTLKTGTHTYCALFIAAVIKFL
jgi:hypothetical protein